MPHWRDRMRVQTGSFVHQKLISNSQCTFEQCRLVSEIEGGQERESGKWKSVHLLPAFSSYFFSVYQEKEVVEGVHLLPPTPEQ